MKPDIIWLTNILIFHNNRPLHTLLDFGPDLVDDVILQLRDEIRGDLEKNGKTTRTNESSDNENIEPNLYAFLQFDGRTNHASKKTKYHKIIIPRLPRG